MTVSAHGSDGGPGGTGGPGGQGDRYVIGVDFGTLSGRAVVVRVGDGAELGTAVCAYRHAVMDARLAATGEPLPPDWALQDPEDYLDVLREAVPRRVQAAGVDPARWSASAPTSPPAPCCPALRDGTPLCQLPGLERPPARLAQAVEAPRGPAAGGPDQRAGPRARRAVDRAGTAGRSPPSGSSPRRCSCWRRTRTIYQRAERWIEAADWIIWQLCGTETRNACTAGYKGIYQDGHYPSRGLPRPR